MVEITRCNLAQGNIITAVYLGIQRVNNEKRRIAFENAEIMPHGSQEGEEKRHQRDSNSRAWTSKEERDFWDTHTEPSNIRNKQRSLLNKGSVRWKLIRDRFARG